MASLLSSLPGAMLMGLKAAVGKKLVFFKQILTNHIFSDSSFQEINKMLKLI